jgi:hypothetical protein
MVTCKHVFCVYLSATQFNVFDCGEKLEVIVWGKVISPVILHIMKYETLYLPEGYTVTSYVQVFSWVCENALWIDGDWSFLMKLV